jgi:hypothetical protein
MQEVNVVKLPWDILIAYAAEQNFMTAVRRGEVKSLKRWVYEKESFIEEAATIVSESGANYIPVYKDMPHLRLAEQVSSTPEETSSSRALVELFDLFYGQSRPICVRPDPTKLNSFRTISNYRAEMMRRIELH